MNLQGFCTADSPSWCGHLIHTGSSSAHPVHLFSSSAHSCVWPDLFRPLLYPFCLAGALAFCPSPFYAWTWAKMIHNIIQTCSLTHVADRYLSVGKHWQIQTCIVIIPTSYAWGSLSWSGRSCHRCGSSGHWEPLLPQWGLQDQRNTPGKDADKSKFQGLDHSTMSECGI